MDTVLRLPTYHPDLNPIEKIWGIVKARIAAKNVTFKLFSNWQSSILLL
jgi:transposase